MLRYLGKRFLLILPTIFVPLILVFLLLRLSPGDPAGMMLGDQATAEQIAALRTQLGLDQPIWMQFLLWLKGIVTLDLGNSIFFREPVMQIIPRYAGVTILLTVVALALAVSTGAPPQKALEALNTLKGAKGRMELVAEHNGAAIFVDYSHKPEALRTALATLRPYVTNKLTVVFGCGGDRDKGKRPQMGEIASELADDVIVTDDNPRTEDAATIRAEVLAGAKSAREIADRRAAIIEAVEALKPGDVLLVAGKGHETYQIIGTTKHHFSDHEEVLTAIKG